MELVTHLQETNRLDAGGAVAALEGRTASYFVCLKILGPGIPRLAEKGETHWGSRGGRSLNEVDVCWFYATISLQPVWLHFDSLRTGCSSWLAHC